MVNYILEPDGFHLDSCAGVEDTPDALQRTSVFRKQVESPRSLVSKPHGGARSKASSSSSTRGSKSPSQLLYSVGAWADEHPYPATLSQEDLFDRPETQESDGEISEEEQPPEISNDLFQRTIMDEEEE